MRVIGSSFEDDDNGLVVTDGAVAWLRDTCLIRSSQAAWRLQEGESGPGLVIMEDPDRDVVAWPDGRQLSDPHALSH